MANRPDSLPSSSLWLWNAFDEETLLDLESGVCFFLCESGDGEKTSCGEPLFDVVREGNHFGDDCAVRVVAESLMRADALRLLDALARRVGALDFKDFRSVL